MPREGEASLSGEEKFESYENSSSVDWLGTGVKLRSMVDNVTIKRGWEERLGNQAL